MGGEYVQDRGNKECRENFDWETFFKRDNLVGGEESCNEFKEIRLEDKIWKDTS